MKRETSPLPAVSHCLRKLRDESGKSYYRLEQATGITAPYIWRLENGERRNPTRDILVMLALGLVLDGDDVINLLEAANALLDAGGYAPLVHLPVAQTPQRAGQLTSVSGDPRISDDS